MNTIQKVNDICKAVASLTDEEITEVCDMADRQSMFIHPLKGAKQKKLNDAGRHNKSVIASLVNLRLTILDK
jgi:hypothetical protein